MGITLRGGPKAPPTRPPGTRPTALEKIGRGVLRLRLYDRWSQATLEHRSKVDQATISRLERGKQSGLSIRRLAAILEALHVDDVVFERPRLVAEPTDLEVMLYGDRWSMATREADRRLGWPAPRMDVSANESAAANLMDVVTDEPDDLRDLELDQGPDPWAAAWGD